MEIAFSKDEKHLFIEIQRLRNTISKTSLTPSAIEELFVKNIVINNLAIAGIEPTLGQLDALVDDIELYIKNSFDGFIEFLREEKCI